MAAEKGKTTGARKTTATSPTTKTTAAKTPSTQAPSIKAAPTRTAQPKLPTSLLENWVRKHNQEWNHHDWLGLLEDLRQQGLQHLADSEDGRTEIAAQLEEIRHLQLEDWHRENLKGVKTHLDKWIKNHHSWNHEEWNSLLGELCSKGHSDLATSARGQEAIGHYLETARTRLSQIAAA